MHGPSRPEPKDHGQAPTRQAARAAHCTGAPQALPPGQDPAGDQTLDAEQVIGFRAFVKAPADPFLHSPYQGDEWTSGSATADHITDGEGGLYAHHSLRELAAYDYSGLARGQMIWNTRGGGRWVIPAIVAGSGDLYVYETGFRAEHLQILAVGTYPGWSRRHRRVWKRWMMMRYGAIVLNPLTGQREHSVRGKPRWSAPGASWRRWGEVIPMELRPENDICGRWSPDRRHQCSKPAHNTLILHRCQCGHTWY